jgi:hypothetical protein
MSLPSANSTDYLTQPLVQQQHVVDVSAGDEDLTSTFAPGARRIFVSTGGALWIKMRGDSAFVKRTVPSGAYVDGDIVAVKEADADPDVGTTAEGLVAER